MEWFKAIIANNTFMFFFAVVGIPVIVMGTTEIIKALIKHRERMAMIEHGMDPYAHEPRRSEKKKLSCGGSNSAAGTTASTTPESVK